MLLLIASKPRPERVRYMCTHTRARTSEREIERLVGKRGKPRLRATTLRHPANYVIRRAAFYGVRSVRSAAAYTGSSVKTSANGNLHSFVHTPLVNSTRRNSLLKTHVPPSLPSLVTLRRCDSKSTRARELPFGAIIFQPLKERVFPLE